MRAGEYIPATNRETRGNRSSVRHTPGPWEISANEVAVVSTPLKGDVRWVDGDGLEHVSEKGLVALVYSCHPDGDYDTGALNANAHLIAAAPDLYAALRAIVDADDRKSLASIVTAMPAARAALAKAEGK